MREGWLKDVYLILFDASEVEPITERYEVCAALPGHSILGLYGWDDFIVRDGSGAIFTVPTVPFGRDYMSPFLMPSSKVILQTDDRYKGRIKWYIQPIAFGGNPSIGENLAWVSHEQHVEYVRWWNKKYRELKTKGP